MTPAQLPSPQQAHGDRHSPHWWIAPVVLTLLAVPGSFLLLFLMVFGIMAFDPCSPGGCPRAEQHYNAAAITALCSLVPVIAVWCFPHRRAYTWLRLGMIAAYAVVFTAVAVAMMTIPIGE
ncbi:hypothetical protein GCM10023224_01290 [Streptomonospora halophila]|uniref:Transmembrane protein n=1 Tax=Streptomonospora halophila TaxID=427369 RepID=A0ABP9G288_9ACTN